MTEIPPPATAPAPSTAPRRLAKALAVASCCLPFAAACLCITQPDAFAVITVLPRWGWLIPGGLSVAGLWKLRTLRRLAALNALLWLVFAFTLCEETRDVFRGGKWPDPAWEHAQMSGTGFRVVTLNCAGVAQAMHETLELKPDVVFIQETSHRDDLVALAREAWGDGAHVMFHVDCSILTSGEIVPVHREYEATHLAEAKIVLRSGTKLHVFCIRLTPPPARLDFYNPQAWTESRDHFRRQRREIKFLAGRINAVPAGERIIVAGDFNAPSHAAIFQSLPPTLADAWAQGGGGFGNTIMNGFAFHRIDRIFVGAGLEAVSARARKTAYSDHRMLIGDLRVTGAP